MYATEKPENADAGGETDREESCPHLGLEEDPSGFHWEPSPQHRCYLWMQRSRIDQVHQARFCLTDSHILCPWLSIDAPLSDRLDSTLHPLRRAARSLAAQLSRGAAAVATVIWIWLWTVLWPRLRRAVGRALRFIGSLGRQGLVLLGRIARRLGAAAVDLSARVIARIRKRRGLVPLPAVPVEPAEAAGTPAEAAGAPGDAAAAPEARAAASRAAELVEQGILALREGGREGAYALFVRASELDPASEDGWLWRAALSGSTEEKRECLEQLLRVNPASSMASAALAMMERPPRGARPAETPVQGIAEAGPGPVEAPEPAGSPSPMRPSVPSATPIWQCEACETINTGPLRVCRSCGRPSPVVEEELMSSGDELLAEGLAGLKAGSEELAYAYFVKACKASPNNELAWHWRAKTAPTLDEVISSLEQLLKINPENSKAQADLKWALQRREREQVQREQIRPAPRTGASAAAARPRWAVLLLRIAGELRWWLLQVAGICAFALALVLTIPYVLLAGPPDRPELGEYLALFPAVRLPDLAVHVRPLPDFDAGVALPLLLGLLLLHAAFKVAGGGGLGTRVWTALLAGAAGWLMLSFGTNPPAPSYAAGLAALVFVGVLAGGAPSERPERSGARSASWRR